MTPHKTAAITTELVNALEMDLMAARKTGEVVAFLVPYSEEHTQGLAAEQALVDRLRDRGATVKVTTRRADNGLALVLEDVTPAAA
jgi:hypothetical protein